MQWINVAKPPMNDIALFDKVCDAAGEPEGMLFRYAGPGSDGWLRVIVGWASREQADRFFAEALGPALGRLLGPEPAGRPEVVGVAVERAFAAEPVS